MADRRMFAKRVTDDDSFMNLSSSAQALYFHLSMSSDDDGFSNQVSVSMFRSHASVQDLEALLAGRYIYQFENGVIVIRHWRMANALRKDRYTHTIFEKEFAQLQLDERGVYSLKTEENSQITENLDAEESQDAERFPDGCQVVAERLPQVRLGKDSTGKDKEKKRVEKKSADALLSSALESTDVSEPVAEKLHEFIRYRDESKKPYKSETGIRTLVNQVCEKEKEYGSSAVISMIDYTMSNNYQGLIWDRIGPPKPKGRKGPPSEYDAWMNL